MPKFTKHVGKIVNTGSRAIVVFRELPDEPASCLVVESDRLPEMYHQNIMTVINSNEAQDTVDLHTVLARRLFGTGEPMLQTLHSKGLLRKELVKNIVMLPMPNMPCPLETINADIKAGGNPVATPMATAEAPVIDKAKSAEDYINEAKSLEEKAVALREKAYMIDAAMRPKRGRPGLSGADKEARRQERNRRRRDNYSNVKKAQG